MILHFNENINADSLSKVIDFTNQLIENERYGIIYLNSNGGSSMHKDAILDIINENSKLFKLVGYGRLCSAAFDLFFSAKCDRKLVDGTIGMYHQSQMDLEYNEMKKTVYHETDAKIKYLTGYLKRISANQMQVLQFTDKEKKQILKGNEVWFSEERMQEFLKISSLQMQIKL